MHTIRLTTEVFEKLKFVQKKLEENNGKWAYSMVVDKALDALLKEMGWEYVKRG